LSIILKNTIKRLMSFVKDVHILMHVISNNLIENHYHHQS
jgi:hypothetical protein